MVKAVAMDLPFVAFDAGGQPGTRPQAEIEVDEIERTSNPRDSSNNMQPAKDGARRISEYKLHDVGSPRSIPANTTMTDPTQHAQVYRRGAVLSKFPHCLLLLAPILSDDASCKTRVCAVISMLDATSHAGSSRSGPLLSAVSISKRYGDFLANDGIDLDLFPAEIHALLGENGAGKSTLVKTMYGLIQPSGGELRWMGQKIVLAGPSEARDLGIGMVFQHFSLFENLTVAENVALGLPATESLPPSRSGCRKPHGSTACRSIPSARSGSCRSASANASRSCARSCKIRSS